MSTVNPHDKYFRYVFSNKREAIDLISNSLSKDVVEKIDFTTLKLEDTSYVTENLKEYISDLVFSCKLNNSKLYISILLEHKSYVPKHPHLQLMQYMLNIWTKQEKSKHSKKLSRVLPIYIYHGKEEWIKQSFGCYFDQESDFFDKFTPNFEYLLVDLNKYTDTYIQDTFKRVFVKTSLLLLKNYFNERLLNEQLYFYLSSLKGKSNKAINSFIESTVIYLLDATEVAKKSVEEEFKKISIKGGEIAMTTGEKLRKEGRLEGRIEGRKEGREMGREEGENLLLKKQIVFNFIENKFDVQTISKILQIDIKRVEKILVEEGILVHNS
jgi:predicted transposase/invertase (TIGR01784 family)